MTKHKHQVKDKSRFKALILGTVGQTLAFFIISFLLSILAYMTKDPLGLIGIISVSALVLTALISGFVISYRDGQGGVITAVLSSLLFTLIMLLSGFITGGGKMPLSCLINYIIYIAVTTLAAALARKRPRTHRRKI